MSPTDRPRHPSAGNLDSSPRPVEEGGGAPLHPLAFPQGAEAPPGEVALGPGLRSEPLSRLLGHVEGRRVLEMGCGSGDLAIALARAGARVIAIEPDAHLIAEARAAAEAAEARVELHHGDPADLAFLRNDQVDLAVSLFALAGSADLDRVFRQVHRVLRSESPLLCSLPHPLSLMVDVPGDGPPVLTRTAFDGSPVEWRAEERSGQAHLHHIGEVVTSLARSGFRVDQVAEPRPDQGVGGAHWTPTAEWVPTTVVFRARKQGI